MYITMYTFNTVCKKTLKRNEQAYSEWVHYLKTVDIS